MDRYLVSSKGTRLEQSRNSGRCKPERCRERCIIPKSGISISSGDRRPRRESKGTDLQRSSANIPVSKTGCQQILDNSRVAQRSANRIVLVDPRHKSIVRLPFDGAQKKWLMTAYETSRKK
jgi:hypothetical protein